MKERNALNKHLEECAVGSATNCVEGVKALYAIWLAIGHGPGHVHSNHWQFRVNHNNYNLYVDKRGKQFVVEWGNHSIRRGVALDCSVARLVAAIRWIIAKVEGYVPGAYCAWCRRELNGERWRVSEGDKLYLYDACSLACANRLKGICECRKLSVYLYRE